MKRRLALLTLALLPAFAFAEPSSDEKNSPVPVVAKASRVKFTTNQGVIVIELNDEKAPISVKNFLSYVEKKHYDGTIFHRVIDGFMIQGGGFTEDMTEKASGPGIKNEASNGLKNGRGTVAMARTSDPNSATAQFFINVKDNAMLDSPNPDGHGYAVFGKVVEGMDVVDKIKAVKTGTHSSGHDDVPIEAVKVESVVKQ